MKKIETMVILQRNHQISYIDPATRDEVSYTTTEMSAMDTIEEFGLNGGWWYVGPTPMGDGYILQRESVEQIIKIIKK